MSEFEVGQKVINDRGAIGVIKRISPKGLITVNYGKYETRYGKDGWETGKDSIFYKTYIKPATEEDEKRIVENLLIRECIRYFDRHCDLLTGEKAKRILEILKDDDDQRID